MTRLLGLRARLRQLLWRDDADARADEEMRFHIGMEAERHRRAGLSGDDAHRRAMAAFGGLDFHKETMREQRRLPLLEVLWADTRFALRALLRHPTLISVAVPALALGIGAAVTIFSVVNGIVFSETPVRGADDVVVLWTAPPRRPTEHLPLSYAELVDFRNSSNVFEGVAGANFQGSVDVVVMDGTRALPLGASFVTGNYFAMLGITPMLGRRLEPSDDAPGAALVMMISHALWLKHFGGDTSVIGRQVSWNRKRCAIIGVLPAGFEYPRFAEAWLPALSAFPATREPGAQGANVMLFDAIGRLRSGTDLAAGMRDMNTFLRQGDAQRPSTWRGAVAVGTRWNDRIRGDVQGTLVAASLAVVVLLLIACVNVASLLLVRGAQRTRELAIRTALGAGRRRLIRLLVTEAALIAAVGGVLGVLIAFAAVRLVVSMAPPELPHRDLIRVDASSLAVALAMAAIATLASGVLPAMVAARDDLGSWLRGGRAMSVLNRRSRMLRQALVVGQIALAVLVMISAGLITRSLLALQHVDMGFSSAHLSIIETMLPPDAEADRLKRLALQEEMIARVASIPGVVAVSVMPKPPFSGDGGWTAIYSAEDQSVEAAAGSPAVNFEVVGEDYFRAMQIPLVAGRAFDSSDRDDGAPVAIISATLARKTWPGGDALGRRVKLGPAEGRGSWATVVGVAGETRYRDLAVERPTLYLPSRQFRGPEPMTIAVRTAATAGDVRPQIARALSELHPELVMLSSASMSERLAEPLARPRFGALLFGAFAGITMLLSIVGIYGVMAAAVREREREMGIRMALGASAGSLQRLVMRQGIVLATLGSIIGVGGAIAAMRLLASLLYGISPTDPATYVAIVAAVLAAAALACWIPSRRAGRVDPMQVLGAE